MNKSCILITNGNTSSMIAMGDWLREFGHTLKKIYVTYKLPSTKGNLRGVWDMYTHSGFGYTYLKVWTNKILPMRLHRMGLPASVKEYLDLCGLDIPVEPVDSVNADRIISEVRKMTCDYLVSFSATQRFKVPLIDSVRLGAINTHYGTLPAYAGLSPYYWHLHNQEPTFGVTLHQIVTKLDAGPIIEQSIGKTEGILTCMDLLLEMASRVSPMLLRFFRSETSLESATPQDLSGRSYFGHPTRKQVRAFRTAGFKFMDAGSRAKMIQRVKDLTRAAKADVAS